MTECQKCSFKVTTYCTLLFYSQIKRTKYWFFLCVNSCTKDRAPVSANIFITTVRTEHIDHPFCHIQRDVDQPNPNAWSVSWTRKLCFAFYVTFIMALFDWKNVGFQTTVWGKLLLRVDNPAEDIECVCWGTLYVECCEFLWSER